MKYNFILVFIMVFNGCTAQQDYNITKLDYSAQTRGFNLEIHLKGELLNVTLNGEKSEKSLSESQFNKFNEFIKKIDWATLKNNLNTEESAVDRAIPSELIVEANNSYTFEFNHVQLPETIAPVIKYLVKLSGLEK